MLELTSCPHEDYVNTINCFLKASGPTATGSTVGFLAPKIYETLSKQ